MKASRVQGPDVPGHAQRVLSRVGSGRGICLSIDTADTVLAVGWLEVFGAYAATKGLIDPGLEHVWRVASSRMQRVIEMAKTKAGWTEADERTAWAVFDAVRTTDDPIVADYLAGVLAASREGDTGVPIAALIGRLSSVDLRLHYVLYRTYQPFIEASVEVRESDSMRDPDLFISTRDLLAALELPDNASAIVQLEQALRNLGRERLLGQVLHNGTNGSPSEPFVFNMAEVRRWWKREPPEPGVVFAPSADGMALMGWGLGLPDPSPLGYRDAPIPNEIDDIAIATCPSAVPVIDLPDLPG